MTDRRAPILLFAALTLLVSASVVPRPAQAIDTGTIVASAAAIARTRCGSPAEIAA